MTAETVEKPRIVDAAKRAVAARTIYVQANATGIVPLERRITLPDGKLGKNVSRCDYGPTGQILNRVTVRPLNFGTDGIMALDPQDADDMALLAELKLCITEGNAQVEKFGITIREGGERRGAPIPLYEKRKPEALIAAMSEHLDLIADDPVACREFLEACAKYELQRGEGKPARKKVLDAIDDLGAASGVEYGTDEVGEE